MGMDKAGRFAHMQFQEIKATSIQVAHPALQLGVGT
ncbi:hypothetical protein SAMN06265337_0449 [Hymenobacter gelipurpurascens]|uniref:Uncharacterized protein n=1 Tax=Hymenobacter gelipurpurascens TaxID=89968 RepID=A0A212T6E9_9BACT|nr:hypothetical protein SAMN06265337_0449 [Hymenobacter gelipurpurascens]